MRKTVIVLGKGELAIRVAEWFMHSNEYRLPFVVPVLPEPPWAPSFGEAMANTYREVGDEFYYQPVILDSYKDLRVPVDLAVSIYYDQILPASFLKLCCKAINLHNAPLPRYRGVNPINWALKNGETEYGVTIHQIDEGIDDGPIIAQVRFPIDPVLDEVADVYRRCLEEGWRLFLRTIPNLWDIDPTPQEDGAATYYSKADAAGLGDRSNWTRAQSC